jgi:HK97 gp10 family phage protein
MARPNNTAAIQAHVQGLREAKAAFQALPEIVRDAMLDATETTVREIVRHAKARVTNSPSIQTRSLLNAIAWSINRKSGLGKAGVTSGSTTGYFSAGTGVAGELKKRTIKGVIIGSGRKARLVRPSRYAHLVEFGARHMKAEPFMMPAAESQKQPYLSRCRAAGKQIEKNTAAIGARNL